MDGLPAFFSFPSWVNLCLQALFKPGPRLCFPSARVRSAKCSNDKLVPEFSSDLSDLPPFELQVSNSRSFKRMFNVGQPPSSFTIRVPATSANIGPGFDVVGLSLSLDLTLTVTFVPTDGPHSNPPIMEYTGEGSDEVPLDPYKNLITRVALYVLRCHSIQRFPTTFSNPSDRTTRNGQLKIVVNNEVPFGRGLGSSGAAVIAGVLLANELGNLNLSTSRMLDFALMVERHPDNVTAALVGGFIGSYLRELDASATEAASVPLSEVLPEYPPDAGEDWGLYPPQPPIGIGHYVRFGWSEGIKAVAIVPRFELSTASARQVLPQSYSRKDLVRLPQSTPFPTPAHLGF